MSNRKQYVKYNVNESGFKSIKTGLYCLVFILMTFRPSCIMYADDATIYYNTKGFSKDNFAKHITTELDKVNVWLKHNKLSLNAEKLNA